MAFRAFMDESESKGGHIVLAGVVAPLEAWVPFAQEWENALRGKQGTLSSGQYPRQHFKMSEMAMNAERMARVPIFWDIASRHGQLLLSMVLKLEHIKKARERVHVPGMKIEWGGLQHAYVYSVDLFMRSFLLYMDHSGKALPPGSVIDFVFDEKSEKKFILAGWDSFMYSQKTEIRQRFGNMPRFEIDHDYLPIQAADCLAWYIGKGADEDFNPELSTPPSQKGRADGVKWLDMRFDEDFIVDDLARTVRSRLAVGCDVLDTLTGAQIGLGSTVLKPRSDCPSSG